MRTQRSVVTIILLLVALASSAFDRPLEPLENFPRTQLKIATPDARLHTFDVWVASTGPRREQGLMFVKSLPENQGMLFIYEQPQLIGMWMKNTFIPLDMVFIRADGKVARVEENAKPHSLKTIESSENVLAVLELKGGTARQMNIQRGSIVIHSAFITSN